MAAPVEVVPGVMVATSALYLTTTTVIPGSRGRCLVVDPAATADELSVLADALARRGLRPEAAFSTHPHWDHVLWCAALGTAPRYAAARAAEVAERRRPDLLDAVTAAAPGHDLALFGRLTALPDDATCVPWSGPRTDVIVHDGHAPGHAALYLPAIGALVAGDMLSDVEIPLLDLDAVDSLGDYRRALERLGAVRDDARLVIPGHGHVGDGGELRRRLDADSRYLDDLERGRQSADPRLAEAWLAREYEAQRAHLGR